MQVSRTLLGALLVAAMFGGCVSAPRHVVDFSAVDDTQAGGDFSLIIRVTGLTPNGTVPVAGAFVGVATGTQAVAKDTTDANGYARVVLREHQGITIVAKAPTWTTEQSNTLLVGSPGSMPCLGTLCDLTAAEEGKQYGLERNGTVGLVLFPTRLEFNHPVKLSPRATVAGQAVPPGEKWSPTKSQAHSDPDLAALQMLRFDEARITMSWTNQMLEQADVELGVGCAKELPAKKTSSGVLVVDQGKRSLTIGFEEDHAGYWSACDHVYAGPYLDNVNTAVTFDVKMDLQFLGRSTIVPVT